MILSSESYRIYKNQLEKVKWPGCKSPTGEGTESCPRQEKVHGSEKISGLQVMRGEAQTHFIQNEDSDIEEDSTLSGLRNKTNLQLWALPGIPALLDFMTLWARGGKESGLGPKIIY